MQAAFGCILYARRRGVSGGGVDVGEEEDWEASGTVALSRCLMSLVTRGGKSASEPLESVSR